MKKSKVIYTYAICSHCGHQQEPFECFVGYLDDNEQDVWLCDDCDDLLNPLPEDFEIWQYGRCISHPVLNDPQQLELGI
jgi:hypothetical protein